MFCWVELHLDIYILGYYFTYDIWDVQYLLLMFKFIYFKHFTVMMLVLWVFVSSIHTTAETISRWIN